MKYRTLGGTDIAVSEVGFGVWTVSTGWWGEVDDERSVRLLREARERGINYFDTADTYGSGKGETLIADAFGHVRDEVVISTKIGYDFYNHTARRGQQERPQNWSEEFIRFALEQSLKRLDTEYIDFLQLHNTKMDAIEDEGLFALMEEFKSEGKVRAYGIALGPKIGWLEEGVRAMRERRVEGVQMIYNLLEQDPGRGLIEAARETDTSFLTASGERTLGQSALKFVLASPEVVSTLPNIYGKEQIEEFAATSETPDLTPEELSRVSELYENDFGLEKQSAGQHVS